MFDSEEPCPATLEAPEEAAAAIAEAGANGDQRLATEMDSPLTGVDSPPVESGPPRWSEHEPDGLLADMLDGLMSGFCGSPSADLASEDLATQDRDFETVERIGAWERVIAWAQARQAREIADLAGRAQEHPPPGVGPGDAVGSVAAEVGSMLRLAPRTANQRVGQALSLVERCPATLAALGAGRISMPHARVIDQETQQLTEEQAGAVENIVIGRAPGQTPSQLRVATRRTVLRIDPGAARERHSHERRERAVHHYDEPDGMSTLSAYLPAPEAAAAYATIDTHARRAGRCGDDRTMDARRADALVDLILDGTVATGTLDGDESDGRSGHQQTASPARTVLRSASRAAAQVRVTISLDALLGADDQPAEMGGYGPIPAHLGRELAAEGTLRRLLTDPATGATLDYGTTRYHPPARLVDHILTRDQTCRFPGCRPPRSRVPRSSSPRPGSGVPGSGWRHRNRTSGRSPGCSPRRSARLRRWTTR